MMRPDMGERAVDKVASLKPEQVSLATQPCRQGEAAFAGPFAPIDDILSVSPLGAITAPGEPLPAPYIRINTRKGDSIFKRRQTTTLAPTRSDVTAIERRLTPSADGVSESWTVHFAVCDGISFYYDRIDSLDADLLRRAGGISAFTEIGGPNHLALKTQLRLNRGDAIGQSDGFDVGLHDAAAKPTTLARPERYSTNPYARAAVFDTPPELLKAIAIDQTKARCALDYMDESIKSDWTSKLGDAYGMRRAKGDNACRTALVDVPDTAQGAWFTDASHNAATTKVSAIALGVDTIDQSRLIFSLHGRVKSLTADLVSLAPMLDVEREAAAKDFFTFEKGEGRINTPFAEVEERKIYCYNRLRANFVGPSLDGVVLLQTSTTSTGAALMKIEARGDASTCIDLPEPWAFAGTETTFYR